MSVLRRLVPTLLVCLPLAGCVLPEDYERLRKEMADVQQNVVAMQRQQAEAEARLKTVEGTLSGGSESQRTAVADLRASNEDLTRQVSQTVQQIADTNTRIDALSREVQDVRQMQAPRRPATVAPIPTTPVPGTSAVPETLPPEPGSDAPAGPGAQELYNSAYADFSKGNFDLAVSGFEEYAQRFPDSDVADNALYWIGECRFSQGRFQDAVAAYDKMLERYPRSDRAAAANLKKGLAFLEQNQVGQAVVQLRYVVSTYPNSDEARIARDRLASLGASVGR
jgi:tol-pal system protein YbgF